MTDTKLKTYGASALLAAAAGLAAALLFVLAARASVATILFGYFAPMPVMIAAFGYGLSVGAAAAAIGGAYESRKKIKKGSKKEKRIKKVDGK